MPRTTGCESALGFTLQPWLLSLTVHLGLAIAAGCWWFSPAESVEVWQLDSRWTAEKPAEQIELPPEQPPEVSNVAGGAGSEKREATPVSMLLTQDPEVQLPVTWLPAHTATDAAPQPQKSVGKAAAVTSGMGHGPGQGLGDQPGFFGMQPPQGRRVMFVVDNSRSMNHPHDSPAKTRLRRLKLELIKCLLEMKPEQQFYVIFFSNETTPMPAAGWMPARAGDRDPYLKWIAQLPTSGGPTDPRAAMDIALRMQPDTLCFLTDGDFDQRIKRTLQSVKQQQTSIHTFAFGEITAEETLRLLAEQNRGEYRFVP
ncbi:VWA domain-containing protein [bacterium]|nr:VWA domain-containing protein [bacterium]